MESILFQYRKRYGLHAINHKKLYKEMGKVSIPQAVWIACNSIVRFAKSML